MKHANALGLSALLTLAAAYTTLAHANSLTEHLVQCDSTFFNDIQQGTTPLSDKARQNATAIIAAWEKTMPQRAMPTTLNCLGQYAMAASY